MSERTTIPPMSGRMPRGGRRRGAGRKPNLDVFEALEVAGECTSRWQETIDIRLEAAQQARLNKSDYLAIQTKLRAVPISSDEGRQLVEDVSFARREMAGTDPDDETDPPRLITYTVPRPYGARAPIIRDVAAWASARFGKPVSPRTVERAWKYWVRRLKY